MEKKEQRIVQKGILLIIAFAIWTALVIFVDVQPVGQKGTDVGFAMLNCWFHRLTGVHMNLYVITDWLGLIPIAVCMAFGVIGLMQWVKRRRLTKVDFDIILLGIYYVVVVGIYLLFEMIPINYRPVLIDGVKEASYPSSTTLLVLSVMPTLAFQVERRMKRHNVRRILCVLANLFSVFMIMGRLLSGVHWLTDIIGSVLLSAGMFCTYKGIVLQKDEKNRRK